MGVVSLGKALTGKGIKEVPEIVQALAEVGDLDELTDILKVMEASDEVIAGVLRGKGFGVDDIANATDAVHDFVSASKEMKGTQSIFTGLKNVVTNLFSGIKTGFMSLMALDPMMAPLTALAAGLIAAMVISDKFIKSYDEVKEKAQESAGAYNDTKSELESLKKEYESVTNKIRELQALDNPTFEDNVELNKLQQQSAELERQIELKEHLLEFDQKEAEQDAIDSLNKSDVIAASTYDDQGNKLEKGSKAYDSSIQSGTDAEALRANMQKVRDLNAEIADLEEKQMKKGISKDRFNDYQEQIDKYKAEIVDLESDMSTRADTISSNLEMISDKASKVYQDNNEALQEYLNMDLSPAEGALKSIQSYFDGSFGKNAIKDQLKDARKEGRLTEKTLASMGLTLADFGLEGAQGLAALNLYFSDLVSSAEQAEQASKEFSASLQDVGVAFESANAGADYSSAFEYYKKAQELFKAGDVGTDDFQKTVEYFTKGTAFEKNVDAYKYDADAYVAAWTEAQAKIQRYFTENPATGINNAVDDLISMGKASESVGGDIEWNFKTTAEAAEALGLSVEATEDILGKLKDQGAEFDDVFFNDQGLKQYQTTLEEIKKLKDTTTNKDLKDRLQGIVNQSELDDFENNLDKLTEDQIIHIQFEYDLATIQSEIDKIKALIEGGDDSPQRYAELYAAQENYINTAEEGVGFDKEGVKIPVEYTTTESTIAALQQQLANATSEKEKIAIQAEITNLQQMQMELLNAFSDAHPEINADSSIDEINAAWSDFIKSAEGQEITSKMSVDNEDAKEKVAELMGIEPEDIKVKIKAEDEATPVIDSVIALQVADKITSLVAKDEATYVLDIWNTLAVDDKFASLSAQDQATYVIQLWNAMTPEQKQAYMNGEITVTDNSAQVVSNAEANLNALPLNPNAVISASDHTSGAVTSASAALNLINGKTAHTYIITHKQTVGDAELTGSAHINGSTFSSHPINKFVGQAYARGNVEDTSWLRPSWQVPNSHVALTGELGPELVVDPKTNTWHTVGDNGAEFANIPAGAVIFNAKQTKDLLSRGFINSRGSAYLSGTAYANGWRRPSGSGSSGGSSGSSSKKGSSGSSGNSGNSGGNSNAAEEAFEEIKDWVEVYLERQARITERLTNAIEDAVGLNEKQAATNKAIAQVQAEIAANEKGAARYQQQANSVDLAESYKNQVRNGTINIETITDENLKEKIEEFTEWYF